MGGENLAGITLQGVTKAYGSQSVLNDINLDIADGEFQTACSSACSNGAISFGDINDKSSRVANSLKSDRMYHLLESVGTKPNVQYQVKVRNTETS